MIARLFPTDRWVSVAEQWREGQEPVSAELVRDVGARPAVLGSLRRARQLEEVAGFVIGLAFAGVDPNLAIPRVPGKSG